MEEPWSTPRDGAMTIPILTLNVLSVPSPTSSDTRLRMASMDKDHHPQDTARKSARKNTKSTPEDASTAPDASGSVTALRKKRTPTTNKRKGKTGKLEGIVVMPLDVLFEVRKLGNRCNRWFAEGTRIF